MSDHDEKNLELNLNDIIKEFSSILKNDDVDANDNFFDLGGSSFDAIRLVTHLSTDLEVVNIFEHPTPTSLYNYLKAFKKNSKARLVNFMHFPDSKSVFVGFPYGGGDATEYKNLFEQFNVHFEVFGVDFGNVVVNDQKTFRDMLNELLMEVRSMNMKKITVYGHCAGAASACCFAYLLDSEGYDVHLIISAAKPMDNLTVQVEKTNNTTDIEWGEYLKKIGALEDLSPKELKHMMKNGRRDQFLAIEAYKFLRGYKISHEISTLFIWGSLDPVTMDIDKVIKEWRNLVSLDKITCIENEGHYFISTNKKSLSNEIKNFMNM